MSDRQLIPPAVFLNGSGGRFGDKKRPNGTVINGKEQTQVDIIGLVRDNKVRELYVPIVTSNGNSSISSNTGRDPQYVENWSIKLPVVNWEILRGQTPRDLIDETKRAVESAGGRVGKGKDDVKIIAWVEGPFTLHPGNKALNTELNHAILRDSNNSPIQEKYENGKPKTGLVFLDPLDPKVQANLRNTIVAAANKPGVTAIAIDDHFGINFDPQKPETAAIRSVILQRYLNEMPDSCFRRNEDRKPVVRTFENLEPAKANQWLQDQITQFVGDIKRSLPQGVELWASTNRPNNAQRNQLQDVKTWTDKGYIDRLNIQFYRSPAEFNNQWDGLQRELASIPRIQNRQVPVSIALASELPSAGINLTPQEMQTQIRQVQDPNNTVPTYAVAFDDIRWSKKQQELQRPQQQPQRKGETPIQTVTAVVPDSRPNPATTNVEPDNTPNETPPPTTIPINETTAPNLTGSYETTLLEFRANLARLKDAIATIPVPPEGYPKTWSAAERPKDLLTQRPVSERDQAFVLAQFFRRENQQNGIRGTGMDQITTDSKQFATALFDDGRFEVYRTNDYLAFVQVDPNGNVSLLRPLDNVESYAAEKLQPQLLSATLPPEIQQPRGFDRG
jgi:uncharacterized lipoprotein YddW (UPF0748 family)